MLARFMLPSIYQNMRGNVFTLTWVTEDRNKDVCQTPLAIMGITKLGNHT